MSDLLPANHTNHAKKSQTKWIEKKFALIRACRAVAE